MIVVEREVAEASLDRTILKGLAWLKTIAAHASFHSKDPNTTVGAPRLPATSAAISTPGATGMRIVSLCIGRIGPGGSAGSSTI